MKNTYKVSKELNTGECVMLNGEYSQKALAERIAKELAGQPAYVFLTLAYPVAFWVEKNGQGCKRFPVFK